MNLLPAVLLLCVALPSVLSSKELYEAIDEALASNHKLKSASFMLKSVEQGKYQAYATLLPNVGMELNFDLMHSNRESVNAYFNQPIFNFGYSHFEIERSKNVYLAQNASFNLAKQQIIASTVYVYMKLLKAREATKLRLETVGTLGKHLEVAEQRLKLGEITKGEFSQAKAKLSSAEAELVKARGEERSLNVNYQHIVGSESPLDLTYPLAMPEEIPPTLEEAISRAKKNNNSLKMAHHNHESLSYAAKQSYTKLLPSISLYSNIKKDQFFTAEKSPDSVKSVGVKVSIPIFQGGAEYSGIMASKYKLYASMQDQYENSKAVEETVVSDWSSHESAKSLVKASLDVVLAYEATVESITKEVSLNMKSITELLDAEINLLSARISLIDAQSSYVISGYNLVLNTTNS